MRGKFLLCFYQAFYLRTELLEELVVAFGYRTGDNQRSTGVVNQYGVHLIDDGVIVLALYQVFRADSHVVAQIVETEFVVRTEGDICEISLAACVGVGLVLVDAIHAQTVEHIKRTHPFGVTLCQIVVHGYYVYAVSGQCIEEYGQSSHQSLTFTGCHFRNLAFVQYHTAEQLYVVVYHVPYRIIAAGYPVVLVDGLIAFNTYEIFGSSQMAVELRSGYRDFFIFGKTLGGFLYDGKSSGQHLVQCFFVNIQYLFFQFVYLSKEFFAFFQFRVFNACFQFFHFGALFRCRVTDVCLQFFGFGTQGIIVQCGYFRISGFYFVYPRLYFLHVTGSLISENRA